MSCVVVSAIFSRSPRELVGTNHGRGGSGFTCVGAAPRAQPVKVQKPICGSASRFDSPNLNPTSKIVAVYELPVVALSSTCADTVVASKLAHT